MMQHRSKPSWQSVQPSFKYISQPVGGGANRTATATMATGGGATQTSNVLPSLAKLKRTNNGKYTALKIVQALKLIFSLLL